MTTPDPKLRNKITMDCADFQERLPEIIEAGKDPNAEEHVQHCENCAALVRDLEYIAQQARLLLPVHDPAPGVWHNIRSAIERGEESPENGEPAGKHR